MVPLSANVVEWVYGNAEYVGSVFGTANPTRQMLQDYYATAVATWHKIPVHHSKRSQVYNWLKSNDIRGLDYYFPVASRVIWLKHDHEAFAFKLKFGET